VRIELVGRAGDTIARGEAHEGAYLIGPIPQDPAGIRWGCDADGDGTIAGVDVYHASVPPIPLSGAVLVIPKAAGG